MLGLGGVAGGGIGHGNSLPCSADCFGWRRLVRAMPYGAAFERGDAALMQLRIAYRPALLGDPLGAKRRIAAEQALVLLALPHILVGTFIAARLPPGRAGSGDQPGSNKANHKKSPHRCTPSFDGSV